MVDVADIYHVIRTGALFTLFDFGQESGHAGRSIEPAMSTVIYGRSKLT